MTRDTAGRLSRATPTPQPRRRPRKSPVAHKSVEDPPTVEEETGEEGEDTQSQSQVNDDDSTESEVEEEVMAPITTQVELQFILDNVKCNPAGKSIAMSCWLQPGNQIRVDARFRLELQDIKRMADDWASQYVFDHFEQWSSYQLREFSAVVFSRGNSKNPYRFALGEGEVETYKSLYSRVKQLHIDKAKDIRFIVSMYFRLREKTPELSQVQTTPQSSQRPGQKRPRSETATERQHRGRSASRDAERLTGNHVPEIFAEWVCYDKTCRNHQRACFTGLPSKAHVPLTADDLARWSEQINSNGATARICPNALYQALAHRHWNEGGGRLSRQQTKKRKEEEEEASRGREPIIINNILPYAGGKSTAPGLAEPRSSPPIVPGHDFDNLKKYLDWLLSEGKLIAPQKAIAEAALEENGYGYGTLGEVLEDEWIQMGIKRGTMINILKGRKTWSSFLAMEQSIEYRKQAELQERERETISIDSDDEGVEDDEYRTPGPSTA